MTEEKIKRLITLVSHAMIAHDIMNQIEDNDEIVIKGYLSGKSLFMNHLDLCLNLARSIDREVLGINSVGEVCNYIANIHHEYAKGIVDGLKDVEGGYSQFIKDYILNEEYMLSLKEEAFEIMDLD